MESSSLLERYQLASAAGFKGVECAFPYDFSCEQVANAKKKANVQQILVNAYPGDWGKGERGLAAIPGKEEDFKESIKKAVQYAKALDCNKIHVMSGVVDKETKENLDVYIMNLKFASQIFQENNIVGVIEPINQYSLPNYFLNDFHKALSVIQTIGSPNLKLQLDLFHLQHIAGDLTNNIKALLPFVGHIQVAQVPDRHEPNTAGEINYRYIFRLLESLGYDDWIGLEYTPRSDSVKGLTWVHELGYSL